MVAREDRIPRIEVWNMFSFKRTLGEAGVKDEPVPKGMDTIGALTLHPLGAIPVYENPALAVGRVRIVTAFGEERIIRVAVR